MECEECGNELTIINGKFENYNYCFCCGNAQKISVIATQINSENQLVTITA
jgi:hypothetical protein